ncbi:unnamed protein product, partial [Didymodactylos carnosus]
FSNFAGRPEECDVKYGEITKQQQEFIHEVSPLKSNENQQSRTVKIVHPKPPKLNESYFIPNIFNDIGMDDNNDDIDIQEHGQEQDDISLNESYDVDIYSKPISRAVQTDKFDVVKLMIENDALKNKVKSLSQTITSTKKTHVRMPKKSTIEYFKYVIGRSETDQNKQHPTIPLSPSSLHVCQSTTITTTSRIIRKLFPLEIMKKHDFKRSSLIDEELERNIHAERFIQSKKRDNQSCFGETVDPSLETRLICIPCAEAATRNDESLSARLLYPDPHAFKHRSASGERAMREEPENTNFCSWEECSPFYQACRENKIDDVKEFLRTMIPEEIDKMEPNGSTALHMACYYGNIEIVRLILDADADRGVTNKFKCLPYDEAASDEVKALFIRVPTSNRLVSNTGAVEWVLIDDDVLEKAAESRGLIKYAYDRNMSNIDKMFDRIQKNYVDKLLRISRGIDGIKIRLIYVGEIKFQVVSNLALVRHFQYLLNAMHR